MQHASEKHQPKAEAKAPDPEAELVDEIAEFDRDPLGYVMFAFPWGEGELAGHTGPLDWQRDVLVAIRDGMSPDRALRIAIASGHGIGKSALVSWIILWSISTCVDTIGVVTANTGDQLKLKTWVQLGKWHRLSINAHWFEVTAKAIFSTDPEHAATWRIDAVTWNETRTEAFAGLHNEGKRIVLLYDEASGIPDSIWDVSTGALTDQNTEIIWTAFGNPTRNVGRFRECFPGGRFAHRWNPKQIDSRDVPITNKAEIAEWEADYGEDSDFFRVRVKGVFPKAGTSQFISSELVSAAADPKRDAEVTLYDPLVMGVDVARFGDDQTVFRFRRGRDARSIKPMKFRGLDTMQIAARVAEAYARYQPDAIFIDNGGFGAGVVDRCNYLHLPALGIDFGASPDNEIKGRESGIWYYNKRAEMWGAMRDWLSGGMIDDDPELVADLPAVEYGYAMKNARDCIALEKKEHMKARGLSSPDNGDALALTFAHPVAPADQRHKYGNQAGSGHQYEYDPMAQR
ncbi:terminase [Bradyrhizobium sp. PMVTL-01]|uniref:terminase n=1 Tax=Bradyrhizobium sp. PMVTL-01 TaxID=3434999 RepID=UPI003F7143C0